MPPFLPHTWEGWAALLALVAYIVFREKFHRWLQGRS